VALGRIERVLQEETNDVGARNVETHRSQFVRAFLYPLYQWFREAK